MINICLQFFFGEKHAFVFSTYYETKMWELCMRSVASNVEYFI